MSAEAASGRQFRIGLQRAPLQSVELPATE